MNINPIKQIYRFNKEAGLLDKGYDDRREIAYPIEEMLEGTNDLVTLADILEVSNNGEDTKLPKLISREIADIVQGHAEAKPLSDVDRLDKHLDTIVFSFGSIFKLGLTPQQAMRTLEVVMNANMQKLKVGQDSEGKQMKPDDFVGPEKQLQKILNER